MFYSAFYQTSSPLHPLPSFPPPPSLPPPLPHPPLLPDSSINLFPPLIQLFTSTHFLKLIFHYLRTPSSGLCKFYLVESISTWFLFSMERFFDRVEPIVFFALTRPVSNLLVFCFAVASTLTQLLFSTISSSYYCWKMGSSGRFQTRAAASVEPWPP